MSSFLVAVPEALQGAAQDLAGIGSTLSEAAASAAAPTTGIVAAAEDEISAAIAKIFGEYGQEYQALSAQAQAFHAEFTNSLHAGAGAYLSSEIANIEQLGQSLGGAVAGAAHSAAVPIQATSVGSLLGGVEASVQHSLSGFGAALQTGGVGAAVRALQAAIPAQTGIPLIDNSLMNLGEIFNEIMMDPFPVLSQFFTNQMHYINTIMTQGLPGTPGFMTNLQTALNGLMGFPATALNTIQEGFGPLIASLGTAISDFPGLIASGVGALLAGNPLGAIGDIGTAFLNFVLQPPYINIDFPMTGDLITIHPFLVGPLGDLMNAILVPGLLFQQLAHALSPTLTTVPSMIAQNVGNVLLTLFKSQIDLGLDLVLNTTSPFLHVVLDNTFTLPVQLLIDAIGAPVAGLLAPGGLIPTLTTLMDDLTTGNLLGGLNTLFGAPASVLNAFLNGTFELPLSIDLPISLPPISLGSGIFGGTLTLTNIGFSLNLPFSGLLVGENPITGMINGHAVGTGLGGLAAALVLNALLPLDITSAGTPISGLLKGLLVFAPQAIQNALTPGTMVDPIGFGGFPPGTIVEPLSLGAPAALANALTPPTGSVGPLDLAA